MANQNVTVTVDKSQILDAIRTLQQLIGYEQQASQNIRINVDTSGLDRATHSAEQFASTLRDISTILQGFGSGFNALGNFSSGIGNAFSQMSTIFSNTNISNAMASMLTRSLTNSLTSNISNIITRYDIMSTFVPYMNVAGVDSTTATNALNRVNESILGLPIGLDESAQRLRRYQMFLGNVDQATNLTIGLQNAIIAGGANSQMQNMAYTQIDRLLSAGRLNQSRQWLSLIQGLGVSMRFISEQMGVAGMDVRTLASGLASGAISTQQFLDALMALGEGESQAAQGLEATLEIYKETIEAWINNINYAFARGGKNVLDSVNEVLVGETGMGVTGYMKVYRDFLNDAFSGIAGWVKDNPGAIRDVLGDAYQLLQSVQRFSASEIGSGVLDGLGRTFSMISTALSSIPEGKLEEFVSFATTIAGPASKIMEASSGLGILAGVFERFKDFDFDMLIGDIADEIGRMASVIERLLNLVGDERMSQLLAFGLVWGKPIGSALGAGANALSTIAMMRLAFGGLGGDALFGSLGTMLGAGASALGGFMLTPAGLALAGTAAAFAGGRALNNAWMQRDVDMLRNQFGANIPVLAYQREANDALSRIDSSYQSYANYPFLSATSAKTAAVSLQGYIDEETALYAKNAQALLELETARANLISEYERASGAPFNTSLLLNEDAQENAALVGDSQLLHGFDETLASYDADIEQTKLTMDALNEAIVYHGTELGKLNIQYGVYMDGVTAATEETKFLTQANEGLLTVYTELNEVISEAFAKQVGGMKALDIGTPSKETGSFLADYVDILTGNTDVGELFNQSVGSIAEYINTHPDQVGVGSLTEMVRNLIGQGDVETTAPILDELATALESGNWDRVQVAIDSYTANVEAQKANLDAAMDALEAAESKMIQFRETLQPMLATDANGFAVFDPLDTDENNYLNNEAWENRFALLEDSTAAGMAAVAQAAADGGEEVPEAVGEVPGEIESYGPEYQTATASLGPPMEAGFRSAATYVETGASVVISAVQAAIAEIEAAASGVSIEIPVTVSTTTSGTVTPDVTPTSTAGFATGGSVWKPFGSDTVPAMLTPGEYIIRKGAADFFGRGLLERINALDISGACDRLILNSPLMGRYGGNVYNRDNHASVNQTFINSSPDYGRRRAWRFATQL